MELGRKQGNVLATAAVGIVGALLLVGISSFGIWDPWELTSADEARHLLAGEPVELGRSAIAGWVVASGFALFGVHEWSGRLPIALTGLLTLVIVYVLVRRFEGRRAGVFAIVVAGTSPLFLLNARQMLGDAPVFAAQALTGLAALAAIYRPTLRDEAAEKTKRMATIAWLVVMIASAILASLLRGALLGALAPLCAVALVAAVQGLLLAKPSEDPRRAVAVYVVTAAALVVGLGVVRAVIADVADYSTWLGGRPRGGNPPTFEVGLEAIFHAFAPWSALLPLALGRLLLARDAEAPTATGDAATAPAEGEEAPHASAGAFRLALVLWAAFGYGALTLYEARYGPGSYVPVAALGAAVAVLMRDLERSREASWTGAVVAFLFVGLLIRDFDLYPGGPVEGLSVDELTIPEVFNPKAAWSIVLGLFGVMAALALVAAPAPAPAAPAPDAEARAAAKLPDLKAPYRFLRAQWDRGRPYKAWLVLGALFVVFCLVVALVSLTIGESIGLTSLVLKWSLRVGLLPFVLPVLVAGAQLVLFGAKKLAAFRMLPLLVAGIVVGGYASQGFLPALSAHFSPREVYDTFNRLSSAGEVLAEYRVGGRAAAYYARGELTEIDQQDALVALLADRGSRKWAAFPAEELPAIDRAYRRSTGEHLFVVDARSARVVLATNQPVRGVENQSFVARFVRDRVPDDMQHPVHAMLEDKIELVGYDLDLPHGDYVGPGESFTVTWYWRALHASPGSWKIFLHIDGQGNRLNGDHDPVGDKYPVRLWDEGDVVVDVQELTVPANYRPGPYVMFIGMYAGNNRLEVREGPKDTENRVRAGTFMVR
jgi:hypothetical protein